MKLIVIIFTFLLTPIFSIESSYKGGTNSGESKYDRIGRIEKYLDKISGKLTKLHLQMDTAVSKKLKKLEEKMGQKRINAIEAALTKMDIKLKPLFRTGQRPSFALKVNTDEVKSIVEEHNVILIELKETIKKLEKKISVLEGIDRPSEVSKVSTDLGLDIQK